MSRAELRGGWEPPPLRGQLLFAGAPAWGCLILCLTGCFAPPPQFPLNAVRVRKWERDFRQEFSLQRKRDLSDAMVQLFGSPNAPCLPELDGAKLLDLAALAAAAGPVASDQQGRPRGLYRKHCVHCHGLAGDGAGPTASYLNPYPRDFRPGIYKFKSTPKGEKPTHEDLRRILVEGIPGTAMPSYRALPATEIEPLVHYVKYLSVRGEVERALIDYAANELAEEEPLIDEDAGPEEQQRQLAAIGRFAAKVFEGWGRAEARVTPVPPADARGAAAASVARGRELYFGEVAGCVKCHGATGQGDGQTADFDDWTKELDPTNPDALAAYRDAGALAPRTIRPRNFRLGVYRGGSRPEDLFRRVRYGIDGTPMPEAFVKPQEAPQGVQGLTARDIWSLVDYVRSLRGQRGEAGRAARAGPRAFPAVGGNRHSGALLDHRIGTPTK